jgi:hypothetical protein
MPRYEEEEYRPRSRRHSEESYGVRREPSRLGGLARWGELEDEGIQGAYCPTCGAHRSQQRAEDLGYGERRGVTRSRFDDIDEDVEERDRSTTRRGFASLEPEERDERETGQRRGSSSRRGFASMDPEERREISSRGGRASHGYR